MKKTVFTLLACALLTSCNGVVSSMHYTKGTQLIECGDYHAAVEELEKAIRLNPGHAHHHTNLSYAYLRLGNSEQAWYHARQAVLCPHPKKCDVSHFKSLCHERIHARGLDRPETPYDIIIADLGRPDVIKRSEEGVLIECHFGTCVMNFSNGRLTGCRL